ncbi:hypothetical protein V8C44DRAFT_353725 [Trichoderma aethiopicum]
MPRPSPATSQAYQKLQAGSRTSTDKGRKFAAVLAIFLPPKDPKDGKILPGIRHLLSRVLSFIPRAMPPLRALRVNPPGCQGRAKTSGHFRLPHICRYLGGGAAEHPRQVRRSAE